MWLVINLRLMQPGRVDVTRQVQMSAMTYGGWTRPSSFGCRESISSARCSVADRC